MIAAMIILLCLAIAVFVIGYLVAKDDEAPAQLGLILKLVSGVLLLSSIIFGACSGVHVVPAGHSRVLNFFGAVDEHPLKPGLNYANPLKDKVDYSTRTEVYAAAKDTSKIEGAAQIYGDSPIKVLSSDGLRVKIELAVWFRVLPDSAPRIYKTIGTDYIDKIIKQYTRAAARDATERYAATELYQSRSRLSEDIEVRLKKEFKKRGLVCEKVALRDIQLDKLVSDAISQKMQAQQEAQKMEFRLQKEEKEAERKRIEAKGIKDSQDIIQQTLTEEYLMYYYIETLRSLVNSPNNTVMILPADQNLTPMLNVPGGKPFVPKVPKPPAK